MVVNFKICVKRTNSIQTEILMGNETNENTRILNINI